MDVVDSAEAELVTYPEPGVAHRPSPTAPPPLPIEAFESAELDLDALQEAVARANAAKAAVDASTASTARSVEKPRHARRPSARRQASAVRVHVNEQGRLAAGQTIAGTLTDISVSGAFLASERTLKPGTEVTLRFSLPLDSDGRSGAVEVRAEVRHRGRNQPGVGLRFLRMPSDAMRVIEEYLAERRA